MEQRNLLPESSRFFKKILLVLLLSIAFAAAINHYEATALVLRFILQVFYPIFVGIAFAFILSIPQQALEKILRRHRRLQSHARSLSIVLSLTGGIMMLLLFANAFIPQFVQTLRGFGTALPEALHEVAAALDGVPTLQKYVVELESVDWNQMMQRVQEYLASGQTEAVYSAVHTTAEFVTMMVETFVGIILGIYFLGTKEMLTRQMRQMLYAFCTRKNADHIAHIGGVFRQKFYAFVCGQMLDSFIFMMGLFTGMILFGIPHAAMVSAIVVFTGLIPMVGGVIGGAIGAVFIFVESPTQALIFIILLIVLHQIDSNFIYPRIMGRSLGLPEVWSFIAIIVGGGLFGVLGMLLGVPVFSAVYTLLGEYTRNRLKEKEHMP
ncbi:AI-2E family transporter [Selenomonas artemidis]|uniref:AI-2E family transporter n=1 Tax=Selenomonas artemidis TaxID=671224 RepID=UPI002889FF57|nr:AI-2E family transporter [Selenomonas artemidis]